MTRISRILLLSGFACLTILLSACNTTKGVGEDLQSGGENLSGSAQKHGARP